MGNAARAQHIAQQATSGGGGPYPYLDTIQQSFGEFDIGGISAHLGGAAEASAAELGAEGYAFGDSVVLASSPSLRVAAHEAAHVVQQRAGNAPSSGMGEAGDQYERFADRVADAVVSGRDASALLRQVAAPGQDAVSQPAVQMWDRGEKEVSGQAMSRINDAKAGIEHTKSVLSHGAGNQREALEATNFNSYFRMAAMRDPECWNISPLVHKLCTQYPEALTAAKADLAQGGNCGEHAAIAYDYLRTNTREMVHMSSKEGLDHAFVVMGDPDKDSDSELVICDPWPTAPTACLWEDHFAFTEDRGNLNLRNSIIGDGRNIKAAIAAGLSLSEKGRAYIKHALSEEKTREEIEKGTSRENGNKPWIWEHRDAASRQYSYVTQPEETTTPETDTSDQTSGSADLTDGEQDYLSWVRRSMGRSG